VTTNSCNATVVAANRAVHLHQQSRPHRPLGDLWCEQLHQQRQHYNRCDWHQFRLVIAKATPTVTGLAPFGVVFERQFSCLHRRCERVGSGPLYGVASAFDYDGGQPTNFAGPYPVSANFIHEYAIPTKRRHWQNPASLTIARKPDDNVWHAGDGENFWSFRIFPRLRPTSSFQPSRDFHSWWQLASISIASFKRFPLPGGADLCTLPASVRAGNSDYNPARVSPAFVHTRRIQAATYIFPRCPSVTVTAVSRLWSTSWSRTHRIP